VFALARFQALPEVRSSFIEIAAVLFPTRLCQSKLNRL